MAKGVPIKYTVNVITSRHYERCSSGVEHRYYFSPLAKKVPINLLEPEVAGSIPAISHTVKNR